MAEESDDPPFLNDANPRLIRRYQRGSLWKAFVRVVAGVMVTMILFGWLLNLLTISSDMTLALAAIIGAAALVVLVSWERGWVLREPIWEGSKDLRAQTYRASASRFDSSGVTVVDPNSRSRQE